MHKKNNTEEDSTSEPKRKWQRIMLQSQVPKRLWDFGIVWEEEVLYRTAFGNEKHNIIERTTRYTTEISKWIKF